MSHPLHPALVHFPIASWTLASAADFGARIWPLAWLSPAAAALLAVGMLGGLAAAAAGLYESLRVLPDDPATRTVYWHMGMALSAWCLYAASLLLRMEDGSLADTPDLSLALDAAGLACLGLTGWLGGRLVYGHGVGIRHR